MELDKQRKFVREEKKKRSIAQKIEKIAKRKKKDEEMMTHLLTQQNFT